MQHHLVCICSETRRGGRDKGARRAQELAMSRSVRVKCDDVELKLTLNANLLKKSFTDSVLIPFLKAYSTRCKLQHVLCIDNVLSVSVNEECLKELSLPASVVLLTGEQVCVQIYLRADSGKQPPICQDPFGGTSRPQEAPMASNTSSLNCRDLSMDGMSEIERIKEERRAARLAKEADGTAPTSSSAQDAEPKLEAGVRVTVFGLETEAGRPLNGQRGVVVSFVEDSGRYAVKLDSQADRSVNVRRENLQLQSSVESSAAPEAAEAVSGALAQLTDLETQAAKLRDALSAEQKALDGLDLQDVEADESLDAIGKKVTAAAAAVAKLQVGLDELDLCDLDDEARGAARTRRKALNASVEGSLQPLAAALGAQLAKARAGRS